NLGINEDLDTESDVSRLRNSEEILQHLAETIQLIERLSDEAGESVAHLRKVRELDPTAAPIIDTAEAIAESISELAQATRTQADATYSDPTRLAELDERLTLIGGLKRKYGSDIKDVLAFGVDARARAGELKRLISDASDLDSRLDAARTEVGRAAQRLSDSRTAIAVEIAQAVKRHIGDLGLARAEVELRIRHVPPTRSGADTVELLFSSDHELALGAVSNVASGGELSRLVLAFRLAARDAQADCLVFDEVDSGLGGATATAMGRKLSELAASAQVLCVTHLPQVAVFAERHYVVQREGAVASVRMVNGQERIEEISRMMAGLPESESGQNAAADLLSRAGQAQ
ncbi:MAG: hypothetical protein WBM90_10890, partial [Acidimicrobiia bacterium]